MNETIIVITESSCTVIVQFWGYSGLRWPGSLSDAEISAHLPGCVGRTLSQMQRFLRTFRVVGAQTGVFVQSSYSHRINVKLWLYSRSKHIHTDLYEVKYHENSLVVYLFLYKTSIIYLSRVLCLSYSCLSSCHIPVILSQLRNALLFF